MEPFYFKSYDRVIGIAHDVKELENEVERLSKEDPAALEYHLKEGHIVSWLNYIGEKGLAEMLKGVVDPKEALTRVRDYITMRDSQILKTKTKRGGKKEKTGLRMQKISQEITHE